MKGDNIKLISGMGDLNAQMEQRKAVAIQDRAVSLQWAIGCATRGEPEFVTVARAKKFLAWVKENLEPTPPRG